MAGSPWRIATRRSRLARAQAGVVAEALERTTGRPGELVPLATSGDRDPKRSVDAFDTKGLFVDRTREAVRAGDCHLVVHSHKDLPTDPVPGLTVAAVPGRADPRDALVTPEGHRLATLPKDERVVLGTSSVRRRAQIQHLRPDVMVQPLRGNVETRLAAVAGGELDGVVVAMAGLQRLGLELGVVAVPLEPGECLPAPAQGALAVECREDDGETREALGEIHDPEAGRCVVAERALLAELEGGCRAPIGALARLVEVPGEGRRLELTGLVAAPDGSRLARVSERGGPGEPGELGRRVAGRLRSASRGILETLRSDV